MQNFTCKNIFNAVHDSIILQSMRLFLDNDMQYKKERMRAALAYERMEIVKQPTYYNMLYKTS